MHGSDSFRLYMIFTESQKLEMTRLVGKKGERSIWRTYSVRKRSELFNHAYTVLDGLADDSKLLTNMSKCVGTSGVVLGGAAVDDVCSVDANVSWRKGFEWIEH